jgi:anthranilate phosphoribosyltransferase
MLLMIDNYDSFTYNLVQYFGELGADVHVVRNDQITSGEVAKLKPERIVISPGPCTPNEAGISLEVIKHFAGKVPLLGVCLGHQSIGQAFGGNIVHAKEIMHGKTSMIHHKNTGVFTGLGNPFEATRYHSLVIEKDSLPDCLEVTAWTETEDGELDEIMGVRHKELDVGWETSWEGKSKMDMSSAIKSVMDNRDLTREEMQSVMNTIMTGEATPAQIGGFLIGLRMKGETIDEITAAAQVMRELATKVDVTGEHVVDIVGTGGDGSSTFNISTASCFVVAAAGGKVAKHGNRSVSSKSGSADLLEAAGVNLDISPEQVAQCVNEVGVGFMFAPKHHGAMKHAIGPRKEMAVRTIFNILGPLTNPAGAPNQLLGVFSRELVEPLAHVLANLGSHHVLVVHSEDGMDEISIGAPTFVAELKDGSVTSYTIQPEDFGLQRADLASLKVEDAAESLTVVKSVLANESGPARDIVVLNAGASLYVAGLADSLVAGVEKAAEVLASGAAQTRLDELVRVSNAS